MTSMVHLTSVGAAAFGAALTLTACGSSTTPSSSTPALPATSAGSPSVSSSPTSTPTSTATPTATTIAPPTVPLCTTNIRVINGGSQGAAGHLALVLVFNNVGHTSCRIVGYPTVDLVSTSGATIAHAQHTLSGMAGGASGIASTTLAAGASASALVEASDVPQGSITNCGSYGLMVTPPNQTVAVPAGTAMMPKCEIQVHPVVAGTGGGMH